MARVARVVVPDFPHHITQRGNRCQPVFFSDADRREYLQLIQVHAAQTGVQIWAYCLMTNHVHFVAVPQDERALTRCFAEVHRRYTKRINLREKWRGYLWQGRFASFPMDENYLTAAVRYVENNPVRAGLVLRAEDYLWSSAAAHVLKRSDPILSPCYLTDDIQDWSEYLKSADDPKTGQQISLHTNTGRPLGDDLFIWEMESRSGRTLRPQRSGRKPSHECGDTILIRK